MKEIAWQGSSREDLIGFPVEARRMAGYQLDKVQHGELPDDWKPMPTIGTGVRNQDLRVIRSISRHLCRQYRQHDPRFARLPEENPENAPIRCGTGKAAIQEHQE